MKIEIEPFIPRSSECFWCSRCDHNLVESYRNEQGDGVTRGGQFFLVHGHIYFHAYMASINATSRTGDYQGVLFAVCDDCLKTMGN